MEYFDVDNVYDSISRPYVMKKARGRAERHELLKKIV